MNAETKAFLVGLKRRGVALGLDRMSQVVAALGHPERRVPVIHVAGTNGKGSVAAMIEAILARAGWKTGLYTSPHLVRLGERIQVRRQPLLDAELEAEVASLRSVLAADATGEAAAPSYFEFMTALAFAHFARVGCDVAVVEVGLGGRDDATNVVVPEVSVITSIGLDHTELLGTTIAEIAAQKGGIIKAGRPVVVGRVPVEAEAVIRARAAELDAPVWTVAEAFGRGPDDYPATNLEGEHQRANAATATLVARRLPSRWRVTPELVAAALHTVDWAGRWQRLDVGGRAVIVDASHNAEGAGALDRLLAALATRPAVVVGVLGAVRARPILETVARHSAVILLVVPRQSRACTFEELAALIPSGYRGKVMRTTVEAVFPGDSRCEVPLAGDQPVVVTGSIYLAGEVLALLQPSLGPLEADLQDF